MNNRGIIKKLILVPLSLIFFITLISCKKEVPEEVIYYSEFGARGDGVKDDFDAIIATHEEANKKGIKVKADKNATYYIGDTNKTAIIQTDTDWDDAQFIIDDLNVNHNRGNWLFKVSSAYPSTNLTGKISSLKKKQKNIGLTLDHPSVIIAEDSNVKQYIRKGPNQNSGSPQMDIFRVNKDGEVAKDTPIMLDFQTVTSLMAHPIDEQNLNIKGGRFTTIANGLGGAGYYFARGIQVARSNTIIDGITHHVKGEGDKGEGYKGFINVDRSSNVTFKNSVLSGRKNYRMESDPRISIGSYDFTLSFSLNVTVKDCSQANYMDDPTYWGIMNSNFCKNLVYDNVKWSRFDAHQGVYNATIKNSYLHTLSIIGSGELKIENTTVNGRYFINFRDDYGSHWDGKVFIKNCVFSPPRNLVNAQTNMAIVFYMNNDGSHYFGYEAKMPNEIIIDGLVIEDNINDKTYKGMQLFSNFNPSHTGNEPHQYITTKVTKIRNLSTTSGINYRIPNNYLNQNMKIETYIPPFQIIIVISLIGIVFLAGVIVLKLVIRKNKRKEIERNSNIKASAKK